MTILPFITDSLDNIIGIVEKAKEAGAKYIISCPGTTQRQGSRDYFYKELDKSFPGLKEKYENTYKDSYNCLIPDYKSKSDVFFKLCNKLSMPVAMNFYNNKKDVLELF